jgi:hypothetical protein
MTVAQRSEVLRLCVIFETNVDEKGWDYELHSDRGRFDPTALR